MQMSYWAYLGLNSSYVTCLVLYCASCMVHYRSHLSSNHFDRNQDQIYYQMSFLLISDWFFVIVDSHSYQCLQWYNQGRNSWCLTCMHLSFMVGHNSFAFRQPVVDVFWLAFDNFRSSFLYIIMIEFSQLMSIPNLKLIRGIKSG